jgi:hypothetical protein
VVDALWKQSFNKFFPSVEAFQRKQVGNPSRPVSEEAKRDALRTATGGGILEDSARIIFEQFFDFVLGDTQPAEPWHEVA